MCMMATVHPAMTSPSRSFLGEYWGSQSRKGSRSFTVSHTHRAEGPAGPQHRAFARDARPAGAGAEDVG